MDWLNTFAEAFGNVWAAAAEPLGLVAAGLLVVTVVIGMLFGLIFGLGSMAVWAPEGWKKLKKRIRQERERRLRDARDI